MRKWKKISFVLAILTCIWLVGCDVLSELEDEGGDAISVQSEQEDTDSTLSQSEDEDENFTQSQQEAEDTGGGEVSEGDMAPNFTAETTDGNTFILSEQSGRVVLLNFWASWCGPCVAEMPAFEQLYQEYEDEICILAVNCSEDEETVDRFVEQNQYTFPVAYDIDGSIIEKYPTYGIPYTLVIDQNGEVQNIYLGAEDAETQYMEYKSAIDALLD